MLIVKYLEGSGPQQHHVLNEMDEFENRLLTIEGKQNKRLGIIYQASFLYAK
jgi:hypothetical protein